MSRCSSLEACEHPWRKLAPYSKLVGIHVALLLAESSTLKACGEALEVFGVGRGRGASVQMRAAGRGAGGRALAVEERARGVRRSICALWLSRDR
jgi:hypothetical protein